MQHSVCSCTDCIVNHVDSVITVFELQLFLISRSQWLNTIYSEDGFHVTMDWID